jgi:hypothetical protein
MSAPIITVLLHPAPVVEVVTRQVVVEVQPLGPRGLPGDGSGLTVGAGLTIVGNEIRYDFESLTRG